MGFSDHFLLISQMNSALCALVGILLNVLFVWLAVNKTRKALRFSLLPIVLHSAILGSLLLFVTFLLQPSFLFIDGISLLICKNALVPLPQWLGQIVAKCWLFLALFFASSSLCVLFAYRFLLLKRKITHFVLIYFCILFFAVFFQIIFTGFFVFNARVEPNLTDAQLLEVSAKLAKNVEKFPISNGTFSFLVVIYFILSYLFIIFCATKIVHFKCNFPAIKSKQNEQKFNRQLNFGMLIQASLIAFVFGLNFPLFFAGGFVSPSVLSAFSHFCAVLLHWLLVLLPLIAVCSVVPFRRFVSFRRFPPIATFSVPPPNIHLISGPTSPAFGMEHLMRRCSGQLVPTFTTECTQRKGKVRSADDWQRERTSKSVPSVARRSCSPRQRRF